jgi:hypothetical protein
VAEQPKAEMSAAAGSPIQLRFGASRRGRHRGHPLTYSELLPCSATDFRGPRCAPVQDTGCGRCRRCGERRARAGRARVRQSDGLPGQGWWSEARPKHMAIWVVEGPSGGVIAGPEADFNYWREQQS